MEAVLLSNMAIDKASAPATTSNTKVKTHNPMRMQPTHYQTHHPSWTRTIGGERFKKLLRRITRAVPALMGEVKLLLSAARRRSRSVAAIAGGGGGRL